MPAFLKEKTGISFNRFIERMRIYNIGRNQLSIRSNRHTALFFRQNVRTDWKLKLHLFCVVSVSCFLSKRVIQELKISKHIRRNPERLPLRIFCCRNGEREVLVQTNASMPSECNVNGAANARRHKRSLENDFVQAGENAAL